MEIAGRGKGVVKALLLGSAATFVLAVAPIELTEFDYSYAEAAGGQGNGGGGGSSSGSGGGGSGSGGSGSDGGGSGSGSGGSGGGGSDGGDSGSDGDDRDRNAPSSERRGQNTSAKKSGSSTKVSPGATVVKPSVRVAPKTVSSGKKTVKPVVSVAEDDDSDRPSWAGVPGGKDGSGGGAPDTSGSTKGDLFGDLWVILRDDNGVPLLSPEGWVQPLDEFGELIDLDDEGHPVDESLTLEVEMGRLNVGRAPPQVLDRRADEVITLMETATALDTDAAGRLMFEVDGVWKTIDSPLENLAIYVALMTTGTIDGIDDLPGADFDFMVDGVFTVEDLQASTVFLAAATDKTGEFTTDEIAYINAFLGIETETVEKVTYSDIDYSEFTYDRESVYGEVYTDVLVLQGGVWVPENVNVFEAVFGDEAMTVGGSLDAYTTAAEDARMVVNFVHEYEIPAEDLESVSH
ncbi:hypothetical protein R3X27_10070 [Tropicimonas sp. TH_r6]|nr:hypothetical protein [Tropicimonas sp. TH_r6]